jgi:16S rRNA (uracil1498-N3)-methyltransferase
MSQYLVQGVEKGVFLLEGEEAAHASRVARARSGDVVQLFDGAGSRWRGRVERVGRGVVEGVVLERLPEAEAKADVRLYLALAARSAFEDALEKATELGIRELHPVVTERSSRWSADEEPKLKRWRQIAVAACKQCDRARIPSIFEPVPFETALKDGPGLIAHPTPGKSFDKSSMPAGALRIFIGPEGGFTDREVADALAAGFHALPLGSNVLRVETAAVAACALFLTGS